MPLIANGEARRIAILVPSLEGGGEQRTTLSLAAEFASAGRRVDVYVAQVGDHSEQKRAPNLTVHFLGSAVPSTRRPVSLGKSYYARALAEALRREPPDLLLSAGATSAIAARVRRRLPRIRLVLRASSHPRRPIPWWRLRHRLLEPFRRVLRSRRYRTADFVIAVAEDVASAVREMAPMVPLVVLPSPAITATFVEQLASGPPDHPWVAEVVPIALGVGRMTVPKDFPTLLRAFALVRSRRRLRLVLLGDGPDRPRLVRLACQLGIEDDVAFLGWTSNVAAWLGRASVLVSTSLWEGSPGAIIEAMAAGCPVVATDCPGDTRNLLRGGRLGGLAAIGDAQKIADLIEKQLAAPTDARCLKAAAAPYREESSAAAHLEALDRFVAAAIAYAPS